MHHPVFSKFKQFQVEKVNPDFQVNFLGVVSRKSFDAGVAAVLGLEFVDLPAGTYASYPGFNEEYPEWIDILESVIAADKKFVMIELGAGYARWLVNAALAVKHYHGEDFPMKLIGVEAEPTHFQWMKQHFQDNGINLEEHEFIEAAVDEQEGEVYFHVGRPDEWYGQSITEQETLNSESIKKVKAISLNQILNKLEHVDLIDLDIQGAELVVLRSAIEELNKKVKRIHIGTHKRELEQGLRELFSQHNWYKVNDYACDSTEITEWGEMRFYDGVQTWINPRLAPVRPTQTELNRLQGVIKVMGNRKYQLEQELEQAQNQLQQTQSKLAQLQSQYQQTPSQVERLSEETTRFSSPKTQPNQQELEQLQSQIMQLQNVIQAMEHTKFWKLRTAWFRLKRAVGLGKED